MCVGFVVFLIFCGFCDKISILTVILVLVIFSNLNNVIFGFYLKNKTFFNFDTILKLYIFFTNDRFDPQVLRKKFYGQLPSVPHQEHGLSILCVYKMPSPHHDVAQV